MASGLGVVAFDDAAASELIDPGRTGLLVRRGDHAAFLSAAVRVGADATFARQLGSSAARSVRSLSWEGVAENFEQALVRLAEKGRTNQ